MDSRVPMPREGSIIVAEDEPIIAAYLSRRLERLGWDVVGCVSSGEDAIALASLKKPDLVLMDVRLAGVIDGPQAAARLNDLLGIPSVFLTAYSDRETIERCKGALPLGYLLKPVDEQLLALTVEMALNFKRARQAKRDVDTRYAEVLRHAPDAIVGMDADYKIVVFSPGAECRFGYRAEEILGQSLELLLAPQEEPSSGWPAGLGGMSFPTTRLIECRRKGGATFPAEVAVSRHEDANGTLFTAVVRDISDRAELERQNVRAQTLEAAARLGASVANDFNNLLQAVGANHYLMSLGANPEQSPILKDCADIVARGCALTRQLLSLNGDGAEAPAPYPLSQLLEHTSALARARAGPEVSVICSFSTPSTVVRVEKSQFELVLSSLVTNALEAMPEGGEIRLHAGPHPSLTGHVLIGIQDTGVGIPDAELSQIFEPFFTTKPSRVGAGLGLTLAKRIVERWGGTISVRSLPGSGASVAIALPCEDLDPTGRPPSLPVA